MNSQGLETIESVKAPNVAVVNNGYVTFDDYLAQSSDTRVCEWVDGEVISMPGASFEHQTLCDFLIKVVGLYVEKNDLGLIMSSPFAMKLEKQRRGREPDILFVAKDRLHLFKKNYLDGAADLAIEIISPESVGRDRGEKFVEYEAAGIREYWLIDPDRKQTEFYRLNESEFYQLIPTPDNIFHSAVLPDFFLNVEWLWQNPPPTFAALKELNLV